MTAASRHSEPLSRTRHSEPSRSDGEESRLLTGERSLPEGWRWVELRRVCTQITDGTHKTPRYQKKGVRFISIANIRPFAPIDWNAYVKFISREEHEVLTQRCKPEKDDILVAKIGTLGIAKRIDFDEEVSIFVGLALLKLDKSVIWPPYLEAYLNSTEIKKLAIAGAQGSGRQTLPLQNLERFPVPLPPLLEQRRIAAILQDQLAAVERARAAAEEQIKAAEALPAAYLRAVFNSPEAQQWPRKRLGDICEVRGGKRLPAGTDFSKSKTKYPYIRVVDFQTGTVTLNNLRYLDEATQAQIARYIIRRDDVFISIAGSIGIVGVIPDVLDGANLTENAARLVIKDRTSVHRDYLARYLQSPIGKTEIRLRTNMVGQPKLALERIETIPVPLASFEEQQYIASLLSEQLSAAEQARQALQAQLDAINRLPAALLRRAFNGEL